jgi:hypothetical protein
MVWAERFRQPESDQTTEPTGHIYTSSLFDAGTHTFEPHTPRHPLAACEFSAS